MSQTIMPMMSSQNGGWKRYESYKDSGIVWLGEIPEHWEVKRLKYLSKDIIAGPFGSSLTKNLYTDKGYRVYGQEQVIPGDFSIGNYYISESMYLAMKRYAVTVGDVLVSCVGTFGKVAVVPQEAEPGIINPRLAKIVPDKDIIAPSYLGLLLKSQMAFEQMDLVSRGGTMEIINLKILSEVRLPIPPLPEQYSILMYLDYQTTKISTLISKKQRLVELLKEERTALISQTVTKGLDLTVEMKDSGIEWIGEIPQHWDLKKLKFLADLFGGGTPAKDNSAYWSGDIPWVSPKDMKTEWIEDTEDHITKAALESSATKLIQPGAVLLVVRSGILKHSIPVAINIRPVSLNQDMKALITKPLITSEYLALLIHGYQKALLIEWRKAGATVESIEYELLVNTYCPIPSLSEQILIVDFLKGETTKIDALISRIQDGIKKLKEYSTALISAAVTGKIDVRNLEEEPWDGSFGEEP